MAGLLTTILQMMVIMLVCVAAANGSSHCPVTSAKRLKPLYILMLQPIPKRSLSKLARESFSHIAGARVAQREINRQRDLLPGYCLETIVESTGHRCVYSPLHLTSTGLDTVVKYSVNPPCQPLVAVNGLTCILQTSYISYVAEKHRFDLIHFATKRLRSISDETDFTCLWRIIDSGAVYVDAVMSLMDKFDWNRIAIVYNRGRPFLRTIALRIRTRVLSIPNKDVIFTTSVRRIYHEQSFDEIAQFLKKRAGRVLIIALDQKQSAELLCRLSKEGLVYPAFNAILVDKWRILNLKEESICNKTSAIQAGDGHIYLHTSPRTTSIKDSTILVSNSRYSAFQKKLKKEFTRVRKQYKAKRMSTCSLVHHASVSYDEIWALALAINNSLPILKSKNLSIDSYTIGEHETTSIIADELAKVSFQGASQYIKFTNRHVPHKVKIKQAIGTKLQKIGTYLPIIKPDNVTYRLYLTIDTRSVPDDVPVVVYILTSSFVAIVLYVAAGLTILFTTLIMGLLLYYRESRKVKAISPYLSIVIIIGCYLVSASAIVVTVQGHIVIDPNLIFVLELTSIIMHDFGTYLIYATLALKLLRIMHIFTTWKVKCAILWKDISLALIAIGFSLLAFVNLIVLAPGFMTVQTNEENIIKEDTIVSQRSVQVQIHNYISVLSIVSKGIILFIILCLSTSTRRIDREQFKNTKKVNLLLLLLIFFEVLLNPANSIFYSRTLVALGDIVSVMLVHALLFLPYIFASAFQSQCGRKKSVQKGRKCLAVAKQRS